MGKFAILTGILVLACSGESSSGGPTQPVQCDPSLRDGTYLAHFVERPGGACGPETDLLVRLDASGGLSPGCQLTAPDEWTNGNCTLVRSLACDTSTGWRTSTTAITRDENGDGSLFTGRFTVQVYDSTGAPSCLSTYDVTFTRQ